MSLVRLDSIVTSMVDSFKPDHEGEDSEDIIKNNSIGNTTVQI